MISTWSLFQTHENTNDDSMDDEATDNEYPNGLIIMAGNSFNNLYEITTWPMIFYNFNGDFYSCDFGGSHSIQP